MQSWNAQQQKQTLVQLAICHLRLAYCIVEYYTQWLTDNFGKHQCRNGICGSRLSDSVVIKGNSKLLKRAVNIHSVVFVHAAFFYGWTVTISLYISPPRRTTARCFQHAHVQLMFRDDIKYFITFGSRFQESVSLISYTLARQLGRTY